MSRNYIKNYACFEIVLYYVIEMLSKFGFVILKKEERNIGCWECNSSLFCLQCINLDYCKKGPVVLLGSGLDPDQQLLLSKLATILKVRICTEFNSSGKLSALFNKIILYFLAISLYKIQNYIIRQG